MHQKLLNEPIYPIKVASLLEYFHPQVYLYVVQIGLNVAVNQIRLNLNQDLDDKSLCLYHQLNCLNLDNASQKKRLNNHLQPHHNAPYGLEYREYRPDSLLHQSPIRPYHQKFGLADLV